MSTANSRATNESQIRALIDEWARAVHARDINRLMSLYAPNLLSFDVLIPLQNSGADTARKRAEEWFASFQGPINSEIHDLGITAGDDVGFAHCLNRISGTKADGEKIDMWVRATICFQKNNSNWLVTHEHVSVPLDMKSGKAALDIKP